MIGIGARRSLAFHLWVRLTAVSAAFTFLAVGVFVWLEISDSLDTAREQSAAQAFAAASAQVNSANGSSILPQDRPNGAGETLGVVGVQFLDIDGSVTRSVGVLEEASALAPEALIDGSLAARNHDIRLSDGGFQPESIGPLDLLVGGDFGAVHVVNRPRPRDGAIGEPPQPGFVRVVMRYDDIAANAQTLLLRSVMLAGGILAVAAATIWVLLNHFVARPLRVYNATARSIASGEVTRMPDLGTHEFAELGQTIDDMATALRHQASTDALTGLYNVRDLRTRLPALLSEAANAGQPLTVLVCDLDNMKPINDTYGHHAGDVVLQAVADILRTWVPNGGVCWRTGGDEFVAVMPDTSPETSGRLAIELREALRTTGIDLPENTVKISMSIGTATYPEDGETVDALLTAADSRMYESKPGRQTTELAPAV